MSFLREIWSVLINLVETVSQWRLWMPQQSRTQTKQKKRQASEWSWTQQSFILKCFAAFIILQVIQHIYIFPLCTRNISSLLNAERKRMIIYCASLSVPQHLTTIYLWRAHNKAESPPHLFYCAPGACQARGRGAEGEEGDCQGGLEGEGSWKVRSDWQVKVCNKMKLRNSILDPTGVTGDLPVANTPPCHGKVLKTSLSMNINIHSRCRLKCHKFSCDTENEPQRPSWSKGEKNGSLIKVQ